MTEKINALGQPSPGRTGFTKWDRETLERFAREAADENLLLRDENAGLREDLKTMLDAWRSAVEDAAKGNLRD